MANTYHQLLIQAVFAVKYREAVILPSFKPKLCAVIGNLINENNCKTLIVNGVEDHIHCLFGMKPTVSISELMKNVKAKSSKYVNDNNLTPKRFEWQIGYGVFSYKARDLDMMYNYILNQEKHHAKKSFKKEYLELLNEFNVEYDELYTFKDLE